MNEPVEIRAQTALWLHDEIEFLIKQGRSVAKPLVLKEEVEGTCVQTEPCFKLDRREAKILMDQLWNCGIRPSDGTGNQGQLQATQNHLADMRKIAFNQLGWEKSDS